MSAMLAPGFILVSALFWERGHGACRGHSDCSRSLNSVQSDRTYCCGGTFCCNVVQYRAGVTEDPFLSMSIGAIVGIVIGIVVLLAMCGLLIYYLLKGTNKGGLNRKPRSRNSRYKDHSSPSRPGHAMPKVSRSADYDYPPDAFDRHKSTPPPSYTREKANRHERREKRRHHPTTDRDYREDHRHGNRDHRHHDYYDRRYEYEDAQVRHDHRYDRR